MIGKRERRRLRSGQRFDGEVPGECDALKGENMFQGVINSVQI